MVMALAMSASELLFFRPLRFARLKTFSLHSLLGARGLGLFLKLRWEKIDDESHIRQFSSSLDLNIKTES